MTGADDRQMEDRNKGADTTYSNCSPMGIDRVTRHNPHAGTVAVIPGRRGDEETEGYLSLNNIAQKANMSIKHIRKHLAEIPHYRFSKRGKIWLRWTDFAEWMEHRRTELKGDDCLLDILRDMTKKVRS